MKLYERDLPGEYNLKTNFSKDAYNEFLNKLKRDYPELVTIFKNDDYYGYGTWFYEKAFDFYTENEGKINWNNIDEFVKDFLETDGKYIIKNLNKEKDNNDKMRDARKTGKVNGKKVWHWDYEDDPDDGTRHQFKADGINPVDGTYDGVYESTILNLKEAKEILKSQGYICEAQKKTEEEVEDYVIDRLKGVGFDSPDWYGNEWEMDCETDGYRIEVTSLNQKKYLLSVKDGYNEIDLKIPGVKAFRSDRAGNGYHWTNYEKLLTDIEKVIIYLHKEIG